LEEQLSLEPIQLRLPPPLLGRGHQRPGLGQDRQPGLGLPRLARRLREQGEKIGAVQFETCTLDHFQPLVDVCHTGGRVPLHGQRPPQQETSLRGAVRQAFRRGEGYRRVPAVLREHSAIDR
jgi:hypothetical protein